MRLFKPTARKNLLLLVLASVAVLWMVVTARTFGFEMSLRALASEKVRELDTYLDSQLPDTATSDTVPLVTVSQDYILFGPIRGKIRVFMRNTTEDGRRQFGAFDYFFEREAGGWIEKESGFCADREIRADAMAAFASAESP